MNPTVARRARFYGSICWLNSPDPKCSESYHELPRWLTRHGFRLHDEKTVGLHTKAIVCWSISQQDRAWAAIERASHATVFAFNWDSYEWIWSPTPRPGEYAWDRWGKLLGICRETWVPSACTAARVRQWWGDDRATHVIPAPVRAWQPAKVWSGGYVVNPLREIPDRHWGMVERVCEQIGVDCRSPRHALSRQDYEDLIAGASLIVSPLHELSTGGLTCLEAYAMGKPVLLSDSPWHGGRDYFGDRATYFRDGDEADLAAKICSILANPPDPAPEARSYVESTFTIERMGSEIRDRLARYLT